MSYSDIVFENLRQELEKVFYNRVETPRNVTIITGPSGMDIFDEALYYKGTGKKRQYVGKKPMRILRKVHKLYKSYSGRYYFTYKPKNSVNG